MTEQELKEKLRRMRQNLINWIELLLSKMED